VLALRPGFQARTGLARRHPRLSQAPRSTPGIPALPKILSLSISLSSFVFSEIQLGTRLHYSRPVLGWECSAARRRLQCWANGRIEKPAIAELRRLFELQTDCRNIVLDLKDVSVIDRDVMCFFVRCEADGVKVENCAPYIREWMEREKD
jgi:hypothetical protein